MRKQELSLYIDYILSLNFSKRYICSQSVIFTLPYIVKVKRIRFMASKLDAEALYKDGWN